MTLFLSVLPLDAFNLACVDSHGSNNIPPSPPQPGVSLYITKSAEVGFICKLVYLLTLFQHSADEVSV